MFCLSVSQKVRFLFTSFLQLQKFLWLLLRRNIEQFPREKKELLDWCGFACWEFCLGHCFLNSSPFLPQIDLKSCTQMGWKHLYKYFWALLGTPGVLLGTRSPMCWNRIPGEVLALISIVSINVTGYHLRLRQKPNFLKLKLTLRDIWFLTNQWLVPSHAWIQEYHCTTVGSDCKYHLLIGKSSTIAWGVRVGGWWSTPKHPRLKKKRTLMFLTDKVKTLPAKWKTCSLFASARSQYQGKRPSKLPQKSTVHSFRWPKQYLSLCSSYWISSSIWLTLNSNLYRLICLRSL